MIQELIYTSAPGGLKRGSKGFCTVQCSAGMAPNLAQRLESMSGYRHAFPINDPKSSLNPVQYSHVVTRLAGQTLHVLSRVADAGQDYSGRSNKLAHHIVIDRPESFPSGPARLLADDSVLCTKWDGTVSETAPRLINDPGTAATIELSEWERLTGDEGWSGAIAEHLMAERSPFSVIFPPGCDVLPLVREICDLIPDGRRWEVTFSTYFSRLLAGTECQLRFVLDGTSEATSLRNDARARLVDLTSTPGRASGGDWVALARTGRLTRSPSPHVPADAGALTGDTAHAAVADGSASAESATRVKDQSTSSTRSTRDSTAAATPTASDPAERPPDIFPHAGSATSGRAGRAFRSSRSSTGNSRMLAVVITMMLVGMVAAGYFVVPHLLKSTSNAPAPQTMSQSGKSDRKTSGTATEPAEEASALPFDGRGPFAELDGQPANWRLGIPGDESQAPESLHLLLTTDEPLQISAAHQNVSIEKEQAENGGWNLSINTGDGGFVVGNIDCVVADGKEGMQLTFDWAAEASKNAAWRQAVFGTGDRAGLGKRSLILTARRNGGSEAVSQEIQLSVDHPFRNVDPNAADSSAPDQQATTVAQLWKPNEEWVLPCYPEELIVSMPPAVANDGRLTVTKQSAVDRHWDIAHENLTIATIESKLVENGTRLLWKLSEPGADRGDSRATDGLWLLGQSPNISVVMDRPDTAPDKIIERQLETPKLATIQTQFDKLNGLPLWELPNIRSTEPSKPIRFRCSNPSAIRIRLHPGQEALLRGQSEKLTIKPAVQKQDTLIWETGIEGVGLGGATTFLPFGDYQVTPVPDRSDLFELTFRWKGSNEVRSREWLRWSPLIVEFPDETLVLLQRRATSAELVRPGLELRIKTTGPFYSGFDFRGLDLRRSDAKAKITVEVAVGEEPPQSFDVPVPGEPSQIPQLSLYLSEERKKFTAKAPAPPDPNRDDVVVGLLQMSLPLPAQEEERIVESAIRIVPMVQLRTVELSAEVMRRLIKVFPQMSAPALERLTNDQATALERFSLAVNAVTGQLKQVEKTESVTRAKRFLRDQRDRTDTKHLGYDVDIYMNRAAQLLSNAERDLKKAKATTRNNSNPNQSLEQVSVEQWRKIAQQFDLITDALDEKRIRKLQEKVNSIAEVLAAVDIRITVSAQPAEDVQINILEVTTEPVTP